MRKILTPFILGAALLASTQMASAQNAVGGAIIGAGAGAAIGGAVSGRGEGAAIGAAVGGITGAAIGAEADSRNNRVYYDERPTYVVRDRSPRAQVVIEERPRKMRCWRNDFGERVCRYRR